MNIQCIQPLLAAAVLLLGVTGATQAAVLQFQYAEDYEGSSPYALNDGNSAVSVTTAADPDASGSHGTVAAVDHSTSDGRWGEVRLRPTDNLQLLPGAIGQSFTLTVDYYIPTSSRFGSGDSLSAIARWNDGEQGEYANRSTGVDLNAVTRGTWHTLTLTGIIPATEGDGDPVTHVVPFISFGDDDPDVAIGESGIDAYFDNFSFTYNYVVPTPAALPMGALLLGVMAGRRPRR